MTAPRAIQERGRDDGWVDDIDAAGTVFVR